MADHDRDLFVLVTTTRWDGPRRPEHNVAEALCDRGDVLWAQPTMSILRGLRGRPGAADPDGDGRRVPSLSDLGIVGSAPVVHTDTDPAGTHDVRGGVHGLLLRQAVRRDGRSPRAVIVFASPTAEFPSIGDASTCRVAWILEDPTAEAGAQQADVAVDHAALIDAADLVVATSAEPADDLAAAGSPALALSDDSIENVADAFDLPVPDDVPTPRGAAAGFIGQLGDDVDVELLEAIVAADVPLLLVGEMASGADYTRFRDLLEHPAVTWLGHKPEEELPAYVGAVGVGIVPYRSDDVDLASALAIGDFVAAGVPVVSCAPLDTAARGGETVRTATDTTSFVDYVVEELDAPRSRAPRHPPVNGAAANRVWSERIDELLAHINDTSPSTPVPPPQATGLARGAGTGFSDRPEPASRPVESPLDLPAMIGAVRRRWWVVALVLALTGVVAYQTIDSFPPTYTVSSEYLLVRGEGDAGTETLSLDALAAVAESRGFGDDPSAPYDRMQFAITPIEGSPVLSLSATWSSADAAVEGVDRLLATLEGTVQELGGSSDGSSASVVLLGRGVRSPQPDAAGDGDEGTDDDFQATATVLIRSSGAQEGIIGPNDYTTTVLSSTLSAPGAVQEYEDRPGVDEYVVNSDARRGAPIIGISVSGTDLDAVLAAFDDTEAALRELLGELQSDQIERGARPILAEPLEQPDGPTDVENNSRRPLAVVVLLGLFLALAAALSVDTWLSRR